MIRPDRLSSYIPFFETYIPADETLQASFISKGAYGRVFKVRHQMTPELKAALKVITTDDPSVYAQLREILFLIQCKPFRNIVEIINFQIKDIPESRSKDVLILMELLQPLTQRLEDAMLEEKEIIGLGIDICEALKALNTLNVIHRDIKPHNIFYSEQLKCYKLGDFGIAKTNMLSEPNSKIGAGMYTAPELFSDKAEIGPGNSRCDLYALGLVMYELANNNRIPFLPECPRSADFETAVFRRLNGDEIPDPANNISDGFLKIIKKACSFSPAGGYSDPKAMLGDLSRLNDRSHLTVVVKDMEKLAEQEINVDKAPFIIGRSRKSDFVLHDAYISGTHCKLDGLSDDGFEVMDLRSLNGTYLNGSKLTPMKAFKCVKGDILKLGRFWLRIK